MPFAGWRDLPAGMVDIDATPSYREVLRVRAERVGMVRNFIATLTDEQLAEQRATPVFARTPQAPLGDCLRVIMSEEWHHHQYAVRYLDAIEARAS